MKAGETIGVCQFRLEGDFFNAYYKFGEKEPIFLGGMSKLFLEGDGSIYRKARFMSLMQDCVSHVLLSKFGAETTHGAAVPTEQRLLSNADAKNLPPR